MSASSKTRASILAAVALSLALAGCGGSGASSSQHAESEPGGSEETATPASLHLRPTGTRRPGATGSEVAESTPAAPSSGRAARRARGAGSRRGSKGSGSAGSSQAQQSEREEGRRQTALESRRLEESREASAFKRRHAEEVAANERAASAGAILPAPAAGTTHVSPPGAGGGSGHTRPKGPGARELEAEARQRKRTQKRIEREARHHHRKESPTAREAASVAATSCSGVYGGGGPEVIVPGGASCTLAPGTAIPGNVRVEPGGALIDEGAAIGGNLVANSPAGIQIKGTTPSTIAANVRIVGLTGAVEGGPNLICNVTIGENLLVSSSEASAAPVLIGGAPECRPVTVKLDVNVYANANRVALIGDLLDKELLMEANTGPVEADEDHILGNAGAGGDKGGVTMRALHVRGFLSAQRNPGQVLLEGNSAGGRLFVREDTGGVTVSRNRVGASAECVDDRPRAHGAPNLIKGRDTGCPTAARARAHR